VAGGSAVDEDEGKGGARKRLEMVSLTAFGVAMACLFIGETAERFASQYGPAAEPQVAQVKPKFNAIDYADTGSTKSAIVIIGPCDTRRP
jgi:hypothetical protein